MNFYDPVHLETGFGVAAVAAVAAALSPALRAHLARVRFNNKLDQQKTIHSKTQNCKIARS